MFNKQKQKLDSKVRFQHRTFTEKLKAAQSYKRNAKSLPDTDQDKVLASLGLDSWRSRTAVIVGILLLIYLVYIPNFLFIREIEIHGAGENEAQDIRNSIANYFAQPPFYLPQKNIVFLNVENLTEYLLRQNVQLKSVIKVTRDLGKLTIAVEMKQERFELLAGSYDVAIYNDGTVSRGLTNLPSEQKSHLIKITTQAPDEPRIGQPYLSEKMSKSMLLVHQQFPTSQKFVFNQFELPVTYLTTADNDPSLESESGQKELLDRPILVLVPNEFIVNVAPAPQSNIKPFRVLFDSSSDVEKAMGQFIALLLQLRPEQQADLAYIDMRFDDRGFVCQASSPCAEKPKRQEPIAEVEMETSETVEQ